MLLFCFLSLNRRYIIASRNPSYTTWTHIPKDKGRSTYTVTPRPENDTNKSSAVVEHRDAYAFDMNITSVDASCS